jgi:hypothetical protein
MSDTNPEAEILFGDIVEYVDATQTLLASDQMDSLSEFDQIVDALAARVVALSPDVIENYQPEMEYVVEQLRIMTATMVEKRKAMAHDLDGVEKRLRGIRAYHAMPPEGE